MEAFTFPKILSSLHRLIRTTCLFPEGEKSSAILVTNLFNKALPLIRYKIDDIFQLSPEQCVCGSQYKKVRKVHGRTFESIFYYGPVAVHPGVVETPIEESPGVVEYQKFDKPGLALMFQSYLKLRSTVLIWPAAWNEYSKILG